MLPGKKELSLLGLLGLLGPRVVPRTLDWPAVRLDTFSPFSWTGLASPTLLLYSSFYLLPETGLPGPETQPAPAPLQPDSRPLGEQFVSHRDPHLPLPSPVAGRLHPEREPDPAAVVHNLNP
jgi:hypothetical protein